MWLTKDVNLPEALLNAQEDKTLVIFAGAGVSAGPPSNLPLFAQLATQVASGVLAQEEDEPVDRFLGRLEERGVEVHRRTYDIVTAPESEPTPLHQSIASLFDSATHLRIITTNFDRHFSAIVRGLFGDSVDTYCAPALPLGRDFHGLVYIHGCADKGPSNLVLTDRDFGCAYLIDGWATRFLRDMFARYVVLFVGYSHDDPLIQYLARGLPIGTSRFALVSSGEESHWKFLGITAVTYPLAEESDRHAAVVNSFSAWVEQAKMGVLDHERRIREIAQSGPPIEVEEVAYIERALTKLVTTRFFVRYARSLEWLDWVENREVFEVLFQQCDQVKDISLELARWYAECFVCQYPGDALALAQRRGLWLSAPLWQAIVGALGKQDVRIEPTVLAKWVPILIETAPSQEPMIGLDFLLEKCRYPEDKEAAILIFEYLTQPRLEHAPHTGVTSLQTAEVSVVGEAMFLTNCWKDIFKPNLAGFCTELVPILTRHIILAHIILRAAGAVEGRWDPLSFARSAIESHGQNDNGEAFDVLIDSARDVIECLLNQDSVQAHAVIRSWSSSGVPLLERLAIHGNAESQHTSPDEKINWLLEMDWLYRPALKHEVFRLLEKTYPSSTVQTKVRVLERADRGFAGGEGENLTDDVRTYEVYNLLVWLQRVAPDCSMVKERLGVLQREHPTFGPREHPDFDRWMFGVEAWHRSPLNVDELLAMDPVEKIEWLLAYKGDKLGAENREGLLSKIAEAVSRSFEWSWRLTLALQRKGTWDSDIWESVFDGWRQGSLTEIQWRDVLTLIYQKPALHEFMQTLSNLLADGVSKEKDGLPFSCLDVAENLAIRLWEICSTRPQTGEKSASDDWLATAINHPGGRLALFWIHGLSKRASDTAGSWAGIPLKYKQHLETVLRGKFYAAELNRVVLASQTQFLYNLDADWTRAGIITLFDWSVDERQALQAWHGYLTWGRWHEALLAHLFPFYEQAFPRLWAELRSKEGQFCRHLASIALYGRRDPLETGWLQRFLLHAPPSSHESWAAQVAGQLSSLKEDAIRALWERWMDSYWGQRITGIPVALSQKEKEQMSLWAVSLEPVFETAVERICALPVSPPQATLIYRQLADEKFKSKHPTALARLLKHLLSNSREPFYYCRELGGLIDVLVAQDVPSRDLLSICDELARLGCADAGRLRKLVERGDPR